MISQSAEPIPFAHQLICWCTKLELLKSSVQLAGLEQINENQWKSMILMKSTDFQGFGRTDHHIWIAPDHQKIKKNKFRLSETHPKCTFPREESCPVVRGGLGWEHKQADILKNHENHRKYQWKPWTLSGRESIDLVYQIYWVAMKNCWLRWAVTFWVLGIR